MRHSRRQLQTFIRPWTAGRPSATVLLIALSIGAFCAQMAAEFFLGDRPGGKDLFFRWLALDGADVHAGDYWRFFTFPLIHHDPLHLLASMALLFFAGREIEPIVGSRHFVAIYLGGVFVGGMTHWLVMPEFPLTGVAAGAVAVFAAYATILPELEIVVHLFFVLPLRLRAKYLALALAGLCVICWGTFTAPVIGPLGMVVASFYAWVYAQQLGFGNQLSIQRYIFEKRQRVARRERMSPEQFMSTEIDPILEKISARGMHSLTRAERKILEQGSGKMAGKPARK